MKQEVYWIWLQQVFGYANRHLIRILKYFRHPQRLYNSSEAERIKSKLFNKKMLLKMRTYDIQKSEEILKRAEAVGQVVIPFNGRYYPKKLRRIFNPPCVLYAQGKIMDIEDKFCVTVVGTRHATSYGMNMAFDFAYKLSRSEAIIISGGAVGVDITAHKAVLKADGIGICVLGCGINYPYLEENKSVRHNLLKNGLLISEFPPDYKPFTRNFPIRNRIMAALSDAILVVEAGEKSGALITANLGLEMGKEIFAIPGNINSRSSKGTNALIRDGAKPALEISDILDDFHVDGLLSRKEAEYKEDILQDNQSTENIDKPSEDIPLELSPQSNKIYDMLSQEPVALEALVGKSAMKVQEVLVCLTELELFGLIKSYPGKRYGLV